MPPHRRISAEHSPEQGQLFEVVTVPSGLTDPSSRPTQQLAPVSDQVVEHVDVALVEMIAPYASTKERAGHLRKALEEFNLASSKEGLRRVQYTPEGAVVRSRMGAAYVGKSKGAEFKKYEAMKRARQAFLRAYNLGRDVQVDIQDADFTEAYEAFAQKYGVGANSDETARKSANRQRLIKVLGKIIKLPEEKREYKYEMPEEQPVQEIVVVPSPSESVATTIDKLEGLRDGDKAGFLPGTTNEKNQAYEVQDYMDPEQYPLGVQQRLREIADGTIKTQTRKGVSVTAARRKGKEAAVSVLNEWGDYLDNAHESQLSLASLSVVVRDEQPNPTRLLSEVVKEMGETAPDYNALVRFIDIYTKRETRDNSLTHMTTRENREVSDDDRNKRIEDDYTGQNRENLQAYIDSRIEGMTILEARKWVRLALENECARARFWTTALTSVRGEFKAAAQRVLHRTDLTSSQSGEHQTAV